MADDSHEPEEPLGHEGVKNYQPICAMASSLATEGWRPVHCARMCSGDESADETRSGKTQKARPMQNSTGQADTAWENHPRLQYVYRFQVTVVDITTFSDASWASNGDDGKTRLEG